MALCSLSCDMPGEVVRKIMNTSFQHAKACVRGHKNPYAHEQLRFLCVLRLPKSPLLQAVILTAWHLSVF